MSGGPLEPVTDAVDSAVSSVRTVGRVLLVLRKPWVAGLVAGFAAGLLVAPTPGRVMRHKVLGVFRAARSRPDGRDEPADR